MNELEVKQVIYDAIRAVAPEATPEDLEPDENIQEALDIDSFDFLNVLIGIDEKLGVSVPEADYGLAMTLNGLTNYLMMHMGSQVKK
jgi:acyl carrier protein